ncbi:hypothetical protein KEM56_002913 [Ascosphaera pollenicola]|nr:hypothetical protein KEM56_002913 [Ascosphaera pollenicola]
MGKVKLARHTVTGEQVAIKIIPRYSTEEHRSARDMERADRSKEIRTAREAAIVTLLHHPYVCGMRDVVRTNYHWYMLFEYVNGGQMLDYIISHGKLKEKQARKFARQVASALDYCHRNSIVHRDLKIENILISNTGDIKIIDFGLSNLFNPASKLKTFCGSLYFAAPELLQARQYTGPEVDIWSFGVVLYVLVCGKVPFDDQSMPQLHAKIKKGQTEYPPSLTADCRHLISRMLVTDPTQRATLHEVMNHPWMTKGYNGPPENYLPIREPLQLPLDPEIVQLMTGFDFGPTEVIAAQLTHVIESEEYQTAVRSYLSQTAASASASGISSTAGDARKKSVFDFYKRRNSTSKDALSAASVEAVPLGMDPLNAFNPLISVYCLVKEKRDRDRAAAAAAIIASERGSAASMPGVPALPRNHGEQQLRMASSTATAVPDLSVSAASPIREPESARVKPTGYNLAGDREPSNIATRNRPRARTHGDNEVPAMTGEKFLQQQKREPTSTPPTPQTQPSPQPQPQPQPQQQQQQPEQHHKKENVAVGLLRRFSTRKKLRVQTQTQPLQVQHPELTPTSAPPQVNIQPAEEVTQPRRSFGMRRSPWRGRERDASPSSANSGSSNQAHTPPKEAPAAQPELLSPRAPTHRTSASKLTRSASVNSADQRIRQAIPENGTVPETTTSGSGSSAGPQPDNSPSERNATPTTNIRRNQSTKTTSPAFGNTTSVSSSGGNGILPRRAHTFRARSLGNARRESIQLRRSRRSEANAREADVPEEPSTDVEGPRHGGRRVGDANAAGRAGGANDRYDRAASNDPEPSTSTTSDELAKPVYLKGLFSVKR